MPARKNPGRRRRLRKALRALLLLGGIVVGLRCLDAQCAPQEVHPAFSLVRNSALFAEHPTRFWTLRPRARGEFQGQSVRVNSLGLRGPEVGPRQPGEYRVMMLGDSCTFGHGVAEADTIAARLQQRLQPALPDRTVRVLNGGTPGYSSFQGLDLGRELAGKVQADAVIVAYLWADASPEFIADDERNPHPSVNRIRRLLWESNLYLDLRAWLLASLDPAPIQEARGIRRVEADDTARNLGALAGRLGTARVLFAVLPSLEPLGQRPHVLAVRAAARDHPGAAFADLNARWSADFSLEQRRRLLLDETHPNRKGCQVLARQLAVCLLKGQEGLARPVPSRP